MASKQLVLFLALNLLLFAVAVHGCEPPAYCAGGGQPVDPTPYDGQRCPIDALKLKVCANVLHALKLKIGVPENEDCCPLLHGLVDLDAAVCLCTAVRADVLGLRVVLPVDITLLLNHCGKKCPSDFTCPSHY